VKSQVAHGVCRVAIAAEPPRVGALARDPGHVVAGFRRQIRAAGEPLPGALRTGVVGRRREAAIAEPRSMVLRPIVLRSAPSAAPA
jgi:hypothetical protein